MNKNICRAVVVVVAGLLTTQLRAQEFTLSRARKEHIAKVRRDVEKKLANNASEISVNTAELDQPDLHLGVLFNEPSARCFTAVGSAFIGSNGVRFITPTMEKGLGQYAIKSSSDATSEGRQLSFFNPFCAVDMLIRKKIKTGDVWQPEDARPCPTEDDLANCVRSIQQAASKSADEWLEKASDEQLIAMNMVRFLGDTAFWSSTGVRLGATQSQERSEQCLNIVSLFVISDHGAEFLLHPKSLPRPITVFKRMQADGKQELGFIDGHCLVSIAVNRRILRDGRWVNSVAVPISELIYQGKRNSSE